MDPLDPDAAAWVVVVRSEYLESPGLSLTAAQARRLWQLEEALCEAVLAALVAEGFLQRTANGQFRRRVTK
jgi:hypothetical protein